MHKNGANRLPGLQHLLRFGRQHWWLRWFLLMGTLVALIILWCRLLPWLAQEYSLTRYGRCAHIFTSPHFVVITRKQVQVGTWVLNFLEQFYRAMLRSYGEVLQLRGMAPGRRAQVYLFWYRQEFERYYRTAFLRDLPNNSAYYNPRQAQLCLYLDLPLPELIRTLQHETTHLLMDMATYPRHCQWSPWLSEGLAVYFENACLQGERLVPPSRPVSLLVRLAHTAMAQQRWPSLLGLWYARHADYSGRNNQVYYTAAYLLVYYLLHAQHGRLSKAFYQYYQEERRTGRPCHYSLLLAMLQLSLEELEQDWRNFIKRQNPRK